MDFEDQLNETAREYLERCPYNEQCGDVDCFPWGMVPDVHADLDGRRI